MPTPDTLREIRRATRHHGIATAHEFSLTQRQLDWSCAGGVLERRYKGVYADPAHPRSSLQDLAAAVAAGGHWCAAWARSSAVMWNVWPEHPASPEVVVPHGRHRLIPGASVHRSRALDRSMFTMRDHIRVIKPLITVVDLGVVVSPVEVGDVIIRGIQKRLFSASDVRATIERLARPGRTGLTTARAALEMIMINGRPSTSVLEFRFHIGPGRHGLPPYRYQHPVRIADQRFLIDFAYPEVMLAIEVDGFEPHTTKEAFARDAFRSNQLVLAGWTILRFTWDRIRLDPGAVAAEILLKLGQLGYLVRR